MIQVRQLLEKYWPWGKPGGGAANSCFVGLKNVHLEELFPEEDMKKVRIQYFSPNLLQKFI